MTIEGNSAMKQTGLLLGLVLAFGSLASTQTLSEQIQQKAAAAREAAARNQQALRAYSWIAKTELSVKGDVKNTKIESCQYGPDGKVQKTELTEPPPEPKKRRGLRGRIVAKKTGEMKEELDSATALARSYVPPDPQKLQAVIAASRVSITPSPGVATLRFADYEKSGDMLTLVFDSDVKALRQLNVDTWLDEPDNKVTLTVSFESMPDGVNYAAETVLQIPKSQLEVRIDNSNYEKIVP